MMHLRAATAHAVCHGSASFDEIPPPPGHLAEKWADVTARGYPFLALDDGHGTLLGYAYAAPYRARSAYRFSAEHSIYLAAEAQGKGAAQTLLTGIIEACQAMGLKTLVAVIGMPQDQAPETAASYRAHQKAGFEQVGILPNVGYKFDKWCKTVFMVRDLQP